MAATTNLSIRIDKELKEQADQVFSEMGMSLTTAINVFVRQTVRQRKIPFEISLDGNETRAVSLQEALAASERIWQNSLNTGTSQISPAEIDAEIALARAEKNRARAIYE